MIVVPDRRPRARQMLDRRREPTLELVVVVAVEQVVLAIVLVVDDRRNAGEPRGESLVRRHAVAAGIAAVAGLFAYEDAFVRTGQSVPLS